MQFSAIFFIAAVAATQVEAQNFKDNCACIKDFSPWVNCLINRKNVCGQKRAPANDANNGKVNCGVIQGGYERTSCQWCPYQN
eukprot:Pgem_evm1s15859